MTRSVPDRLETLEQRVGALEQQLRQLAQALALTARSGITVSQLGQQHADRIAALEASPRKEDP
jgi:hypothetical protein